MATWYMKDLGNGVDAYRPTRAIQDAFQALYSARFLSSDPSWQRISVFSRHDLRRDMVTAYFSPDTESLAERFGAAPCEKPSWDGRLGMLCGDQRALYFHFPESRSQLSE